MELHVDKQKENGSRNSNDGNTTGRAFSNTKLFASMLGLDLNLLESLHTILIAINCEFAFYSVKFKKFADKVFTTYLFHYPWYPMSSTFHKIYVHGSDIRAASINPFSFELDVENN